MRYAPLALAFIITAALYYNYQATLLAHPPPLAAAALHFDISPPLNPLMARNGGLRFYRYKQFQHHSSQLLQISAGVRTPECEPMIV